MKKYNLMPRDLNHGILPVANGWQHHDGGTHTFLSNTPGDFTLTGFTSESTGFQLTFANGLTGSIVQSVENYIRGLQKSLTDVTRTRCILKYTVAIEAIPDGDFALTLVDDDEAGGGIASADVNLPFTEGNHGVFFYVDNVENDFKLVASQTTSTQGIITISNIQLEAICFSPVSIPAGEVLEIAVPVRAAQICFSNSGADIKLLDADLIPASLPDGLIKGCGGIASFKLKNSGAEAQTVEFEFDIV